MKKALFVWIPKNAGTSIFDCLSEHVGVRAVHPDKESVPNDIDEYPCVTFRHHSLAMLIRKGVITQQFAKHRVVFAFLRNPYNRLISRAAYSARKWPEVTIASELEGARVVMRIGKRFARDSTNWRFLNPQVDWLNGDDGLPFVDVIGQVESLDSHWSQICGLLDWPDMPLPHSNQSNHDDYRTYFDDELRTLADRYYQADIALGNYSFERLGGSGELIVNGDQMLVG